MVYIYVLKCKKNKYYVGKTYNPYFRLDNHFKEGGSIWTKMYKPLKVMKLIKDCSKYDEDKYVLEYMEKYDIDNVRGGTYSQIKLTDDQIHSITKQMVSANDMCKRCLRKGHFVKNCYAKTDIDGNYIKDTKISKKRKLWYCKFCEDEFTSFKKAKKHEETCAYSSEDTYNEDYSEKYDIDNVRGGTYCQIKLTDDQIHSITKQMVSANDMCKRCLRKGHFVKDCYAKTDINGNYIKDTKHQEKRKLWYCEFCGDEFTSFKKAEKHEETCAYSSEDTHDEGYSCYRCGREGHYASKCYAKKHIKGYYIRN